MTFLFDICHSAEFLEEGPRAEESLVDCAQLLGPWCGSLSAAECLGGHLMIAIPRPQCTVHAIYIPKTVRKPSNANHNPSPLSCPPIAGSNMSGCHCPQKTRGEMHLYEATVFSILNQP